MVTASEGLNKRLVEVISVILEDTANCEVLVTSVLFTCGVEGIKTVTFDKGVILNDGTVDELETNVADSFGDITKIEPFLVLVVVGNDKLETKGTDKEMLGDAVLVINVKFSDGVVTKDDVLLTNCVAFLDNTGVELVPVKIEEMRIEVCEKPVIGLLKLVTVEDWTTVLLNDGLDVVTFLLTLDD